MHVLYVELQSSCTNLTLTLKADTLYIRILYYYTVRLLIAGFS